MGKIDTSEIKHLGKLSNIKLTKKEIEKYSVQLSSIVSYIKSLQNVATKNTLPTSQTTGLVNVGRKDELQTADCLNQKEALSQTKSKNEGYFLVPAIFENKDE